MADTCGQVLLGSGLTVLSHPLLYIKVLIQVGHEPLAPTLGRNLFGRQVYQLPGLFAYAKHIMKVDGKAGLFKGIGPRLCAGTIGTVVHSKVVQKCQEQGTLQLLDGQQKAEEGSLQHVVNETTKEMIARSCATIVTHPFHVITLRCMVQFIGREIKYSGVFDSIITVYREEGILGFFAGLIPRLLGDVLSLWICNLLAHVINTYAIDDSMSHTGEMKNCSQAVTGFFASMLTYPFVLVSNLMAVNNCGLAGGLPPYASVYPTWVDCWRHLSREGNTSRGSSLFFRKLPAGKMYAIDQKRFF
ncbi:putative mitochondrial carrier -like 2 isoform 2 [Scophthalmus maximus]|uniref:Mitochondrial carrier homolog 2 n=3 Tax=Scophthalmus maximus TaxID=52904 RepID=A0A2U9BDT0_SCOMX|nr:mitochondrial carrier homolog 2 isoform X1 [Scophthalmus maximus]AWP02124.1 putative mitochondrial carrier -like 2 [Scophthalmus maximus]AWP02125.1 putative mitochondrial carrier -like 2 isoform 2 [Scophthalmus maximus]